MTRPKKQTSADISTIAGKYMFDDNPEVRRMAASLLAQDETAGQGPERSNPVKRARTPKTVPHQHLGDAEEPDVPNVNKASKRVWKRWSKQAQRTFNSVFAWVFANQSLMVHPKMKHVATEQWKAIAWNAAFLAADHVDGKMWSDEEGDLAEVVEVPSKVTP